MIQNDMLQKIDVPKYIKYLSVIYIAISIATGTISLILKILEEGRATLDQLSYITMMLRNTVEGFIFWGVGRVFAKFTEENK
ncbi:hypothetical protein [Treponema socranskii]|uniref:hypothetical protein n=1 Tax=Treponema socranskii TaxID=53419 RepID=UPI00360B9B95